MSGRNQRAGATSLTWEPIVVKVTQAGDALPKVCIVGAVTTQGQLLLQGSLGSRMEEKVENKTQTEPKNKQTNKAPNVTLRVHPSTGDTQAGLQALSLWQKEFLSLVQQERFPQPEMPFRGKRILTVTSDPTSSLS